MSKLDDYIYFCSESLNKISVKKIEICYSKWNFLFESVQKCSNSNDEYALGLSLKDSLFTILDKISRIFLLF